MENLPTRNNNPGDIKDPSTGAFRKFSDPTQGFTALQNDLTAKINGHTSTGLSGKSSLLDFSNVWAPASDKNDPTSYAKKLASQLGVDANTSIGSLKDRVGDFAKAIASNEGFGAKTALADTNGTPLPKQYSLQEFGQLIQKKHPEYAKLDAATVAQKVLSKYPQYQKVINDSQQGVVNNAPNAQGDITSVTVPKSSNTTSQDSTQPGGLQGFIQGIASPVTKGISSIAGIGAGLIGDTKDQQNITQNGLNYGYLGNQKPIGAGFDVSKGVEANAAPLQDAIGTGVVGGADLAGGMLAKAGISGLLGLGSSSALESDVAQEALSNYALDPGESISDLSAVDKVNALTSALNSAAPGDKIILQKALSEAAPSVLKEAGIGSWSELNPKMAKTLGLTAKALKYGAALFVGDELVNKAGSVLKGLF